MTDEGIAAQLGRNWLGAREEHDRVTGTDVSRRHAHRVQMSFAQAALDAAPRNRADHEPLEPARIEDAAVAEAARLRRRRIAAEQDLHAAQHVAGLEADQLLDPQRAPGGDD